MTKDEYDLSNKIDLLKELCEDEEHVFSVPKQNVESMLVRSDRIMDFIGDLSQAVSNLKGELVTTLLDEAIELLGDADEI